MSTKRIDLYDRVTNAILSDLERGIRPWLKPFDVALFWLSFMMRPDIPWENCYG
jgi:antirestriction protein ArdC